MRTKFGGVGGSLEVTRSTNPDSDANHVDNQLATSSDDAAIGRPSNDWFARVCWQDQRAGWQPSQANERVEQGTGPLARRFGVRMEIRTPDAVSKESVTGKDRRGIVQDE